MENDAWKPAAGVSPGIGASRRAYPLNCWWVAATAAEVGATPIAKLILDRRIVLFRASDGAPCALLDCCPHRWAPLSRGKIIDSEIVCPYHGFRFNVRGECTHVPTERRAPQALRVGSYPAIEHGPFVWVWMGNPAKADPTLLPNIACHADAPVRIIGHRVTNCNYAAIHENLADTEHVLYLHGESAGTGHSVSSRRQAPGAMDVSSRRVTFFSRRIDIPAGKLESLLLGLDENQGVDKSTIATFTVPGCYLTEIAWKNRAPRPGMPAHVAGYYLWCSTPISNTSCHFWWALTYDHGHQVRREIEEAWNQVIEEDIDVLESIQSSMDWRKCIDDIPEIFVAADRSVVAIRRILTTAVEAEVADGGSFPT